MYKNEYICSIHCKAWRKNDVAVIENAGEIWINQKHLGKNLVLQIYLTRRNIALQNLKI